MDPKIRQQTAQIAQLCARLGVQKLEVFGSAARDLPSQPPRDFDFVVKLDAHSQNSRARRWIELAEQLEILLGKPVDLVSEASLVNPHFARAIEVERLNVYQRA